MNSRVRLHRGLLLLCSLLVVLSCQRKTKTPYTGERDPGERPAQESEGEGPSNSNGAGNESPDSSESEKQQGDIVVFISADDPIALQKFGPTEMEIVFEWGPAPQSKPLAGWQEGKPYKFKAEGGEAYGAATFKVTYRGKDIHEEVINHFRVSSAEPTKVEIQITEIRKKIALVFRVDMLRAQLPQWDAQGHAGDQGWGVE